MGGTLKIQLKANERIFINGGELRVDRKVSFELLNDVAFLLESHVMQIEEASTPLRQLYYIVQSLLIEPRTADIARQVYAQSHAALISSFRDQGLLEGLVDVRHLVGAGKTFEALKRIRSLFPAEACALAAAGLEVPPRAEAFARSMGDTSEMLPFAKPRLRATG